MFLGRSKPYCYRRLIKRWTETCSKDGFSLGQKGCFSARALFYIGDQELNKKELVETLEEISLEDLKIEITERGSIALDHELVNLSPKQTRKTHSPIFPVYEKAPKDLGTVLSNCSFVLPIICCSQEEFFALLKNNPAIKKLSLTDDFNAKIWDRPEIKPIELCSLGTLNQTIWDGTHQNRGLYFS